MSFETRRNESAITVPIYTVYSGEHQGSVNHGFNYSHPQTPPPRYEDVISGKAKETGEPSHQRFPPQASGTYEEPESAGIIFVAPVYKYGRAQKTLGLIFTLLFLVVFVSIVVKVLRMH